MMSDFEYDCWQRKRIAQQAKYRKCGSKSNLSIRHQGIAKVDNTENCNKNN